MIFRSLVILVLLFTVIKTVEAVSASACYGTDPTCDFYSLQCASNEVIRLHNLYAGYKNTTVYQICGRSDHCNDKVTCCNLNRIDIIELFNLENTYNTYTNCSGKTSCRDIHAPWQMLSSYPSLTTSYVHLEYECEYASSKVPFCGGTIGTYTVTDTLVEVMFDGSVENFDPLKASKECQCTIKNTGLQQNVVLNTIDVRLQTYYKSENQTNAKCSSAIFQSNVLAVQCQESDKHYEDNFKINRQYQWLLTTGQTVDMSLRHIHASGVHDSPAMVWISLKAMDNRDLTVSCTEVTPADFTTSTNTTTSTTTTTTTTTTTPKPTTTTTTTTSKPTTTTTTTTPKPTTTITTTTSKPTTTSTTTPKPTTTTTTTTPKPTTTTSTTTPKLTTTTTTTIPKLTTKKMITTAPKPSTTTSTTQKPTTTSTKQTTTTTVKTSSTTTTSAATFSPTTKHQPTSHPTTRYIPTTTEAILAGDGESDVKQRTALYLAICIPVIVCMFCITGLLLWIYLKRTSPRKQKFHFMKSTPRSEVYNAFSNPKILDDFISGVGVEPSSPGVLEKSPISSFISVPVPKTRPKSILSNGSTYRQEPSSPKEPYVIPIKTTTNPIYMSSSPKNRPVANVVLVNAKNDEPVVITDTVESDADDHLIKMNDVYDPASENDTNEKRENPTQSQTKTNRKQDKSGGAVVIHVDNLSLPPVSARSTNANTSSNTSSTRSVIGSTPGNLTPERRNSEPAIISTDPIMERHSASAYVLPGTSPDDSSVLFVK